jgi:hypothetical protein
MKNVFFVFAFMGFLYNVLGQEKEKPVVFTGGMYLHTGYVKNSGINQEINGMCSGIGGQMVFHLTEHFRLGSEGYASEYGYPGNPGFYKLGWGGLLTGYQARFNRVKPMISLTLGGGKIRDLYHVSGEVTDNIPDISVYRVYSTMLLVPAISLHYALKGKINLALKVDYTLPVFLGHTDNFAFGPRFYLGVMFSK